MNIQGLRAAETRLRKFEAARGDSSNLHCCTLYFEPDASQADHDRAFREWCARHDIPYDTGPQTFYVAFLPKRGSSDRALPDPVDTEGGWLARRGLMVVHQ